VFREKITGTTADRPQLAALMEANESRASVWDSRS
jgi:hypothetical protein